jgi:hypothetical protein
VLTLYRKVLDQRLPQQRTALQGRHSEPSSPCSHVEKKHAMAERCGASRFKLEFKVPADPRPVAPSDPSLQHKRHHVSAAAPQGSKRPHSAISKNDPLKTRHSSLLGGTFYSIDEEQADFSGPESPTVSPQAMPSI